MIFAGESACDGEIRSIFTPGVFASYARANEFRSGVRAGPAKYSIIRTVTGFALVGLHDQSLATVAAELVAAEIPPKASASDATTAAALRVELSFDTTAPFRVHLR